MALSKDTKFRLVHALGDQKAADELEKRLISAAPADAAAAAAILATMDRSEKSAEDRKRRLASAGAGDGSWKSQPGDELEAKISGIEAVLAAQANGDEAVDTPAIAASLEIEDITYTAVEPGAAGNDITIAYVDDGTADEETVDVTGTDIVVHMEAGVSTATQIKAAIDAKAEAIALVSAEITGTAGDAQAAAAEAPLADGADVVMEDADTAPAQAALGEAHLSSKARRALQIALTSDAAGSELADAIDAAIDAAQDI